MSTVSTYAPTEGVPAYKEVGAIFAKSKILGCETIEQGYVFAMACIAENKSPLEIARRYDIIQGKLSMKADAILADFRQAGGSHEIIRRDSEIAEVRLVRKDGVEQTFAFTWVEAQEESFVWKKPDSIGVRKPKDNWSTPRMRMQMLWARVISDGVRAMCPEIVAGTYTPEEVVDFLGDTVTIDENSNVVDAVSHHAVDELNESAAEAEKASAREWETVHSQIRDLFVELDVPQEKREEILGRYGVSSIRSLKPDDSQAIYEKLKAKSIELATGESKADATAHVMPSNGPCLPAQVQEIKELLAQAVETDPDVKEKVKQKIAPRQTIAEVTFEEAVALINGLRSKIAKGVLAGK